EGATPATSTRHWLPAGARRRSMARRAARPRRPLRLHRRLCRNLGDELLQHGGGERLVGLRRHDEGPGPADDVLKVVVLEIGFERENRQPVAAAARPDRVVARLLRGAAPVVGTVAGNIDDAPEARKSARGKEAERVVDGAADRGAAAEQLARGAIDGLGER